MKKILVLVYLAFYSLGIAPSISAQAHFEQYKARTFMAKDGTTLPYRILDSAAEKTKDKLPLILFLHGAGERGNDNEKQLVHGAKLFVDSLAKYPAIVLFPQCASENYWSSVSVDRTSMPVTLDFDYTKPPTNMMTAVQQLVKEVRKTYNIDKKRIYIVGLSMGGMGTFELVHRMPKYFAAAIPICGGGDDLRYTQKAKMVPFWVFHGADDAVVRVEQSTEMVSQLQKLGYNVKYTEYPGVNHDSWTNAFAEAEFLAWMFAQKR